MKIYKDFYLIELNGYFYRGKDEYTSSIVRAIFYKSEANAIKKCKRIPGSKVVRIGILQGCVYQNI